MYTRRHTSNSETVHRIIFAELVDGVFTDASRQIDNRDRESRGPRLRRGGAGVHGILLLVRPEESPLPTLASSRLLGKAALREAMPK